MTPARTGVVATLGRLLARARERYETGRFSRRAARKKSCYLRAIDQRFRERQAELRRVGAKR
jgi:hypothetical protein